MANTTTWINNIINEVEERETEREEFSFQDEVSLLQDSFDRYDKENYIIQ